MKIKTESIGKALGNNRQKILKEKKTEEQEEFMSSINIICQMVLVVLYYADNSLLLLLLRSFVQFMISRPPSTLESIRGASSDWSNMSTPNKKLLSQKLLSLIMFSTLVVFMLHILVYCWQDLCRGEPSDVLDDDYRYQHGYILLAFVGERRFTSAFAKALYLISLDFLVFAVQCIMFCINYSINMGLSEGIEAADHEQEAGNEDRSPEYDGLQGNLLIYSFSPISILSKVIKYTKEETAEEESAENADNNAEDAENNPFGTGFGSMFSSNVNNPFENFGRLHAGDMV